MIEKARKMSLGELEVYFEDVEVGEEIPALVKEITTVSMVMYAAATWDFHRYHHDMEYANGKGMRAQFLDGQQLGGYLAQHVTDWAGIGGTLKRLSFRYGDFVFPGDTLTCKGKVSGKGESGVVECELWIENQHGTRVLKSGKAVLELPVRNS